jgi:PadR family transcriptional regulator, regulatory protein PadR
MRHEPPRDLFPGALEMMILRTLSHAPMHGYALAQSIKQTSGDLLQIEEGSLYPALQRLLKAGWLEAEWSTSTRNRRIRVYRVTSSGRGRLQSEVSSFERMLDGIARVMRPSNPSPASTS